MGLSFSSIPCGPSSLENKMNSIIFKPPTTPIKAFSRLNTYKSKIFDIETKNGNINCIIIVPELVNLYKWLTYKNVIIFSHGNASDIYGMYDYLQYLSTSLNVLVISYDYPGYGLSDGIPTEKNCYAALQTVIDHVKKELGYQENTILLMGQSLGTGIVIDFAANNKWKSPLILISPYKSIVRVVFDTSCVRPIDKFETHRKLDDVVCPVKIFHGEDDELINISHGKLIYCSLNDKTFDPVWLKDTGHNDITAKIDMNDILQVINHMNSKN
ncbi:alpha/beta hydrolase family protein [Fadolivirus algeromassiliense]|uniref:Alpha/beta hydrolase family protein n=1 Tax=Fadolivirus FV1/VV64 TaxID=3070911 RepID=A0A7D3UTT4_9VIRU|nr:alpha/beta hydrolase family protein [Fadolivirus algeromassiliense]QKF94550.1 alpha/beta hydrolase family protein [Fadolivirus FV1/VV64]